MSLLEIPFIVITLLSGMIGFFLCLKPALAIKIQIKFYEKINWRIEPISWQKEIRNTRIMGLFLIFLSTTGFIFWRGR